MRLSSACLLAVAFALAADWSLPAAVGGQMPEGGAVAEDMAAGAQASGGCGCQTGAGANQQPPWHGNVQGAQAGCGQPTCRGSNVFQAHPCYQLHWRQAGCVTLPPCLPRLHALCREGSLLSPTPPKLPCCHQCGAPIAGGF